MEIQPTYPFFLEDITVNRQIFMLGPTYDMLASFIGINATVNNISTMMYNLIKLVTMLYVIPDTLLKVSLNTTKTDHHVIR
jgi:hypothetical protein